MTTTRRVSANGIQLHAELAGEGSGTPLVFLHGWLRSTLEWHLLFPHLATVVPCVALDLPGFGQSEIPDATYDMPFFRDTLWAAVDALNLDRVRLVGHGLGGAAAFAMALSRPDRVESIVAASPTVLPTPRAGLRAQVITKGPLGRAWFEHVLNRARVRELLISTHFHEPLHVTDAVIDPIMTWLARPGARLTAWKALCTDLNTGVAEGLGALTTPAAVIWGYNDRVQPVDLGKELEKTYGPIKLKQIPNAGYQTVEDRPASVCRYLTAHFQIPMPVGVPDGHPTPEEGDYDA